MGGGGVHNAFKELWRIPYQIFQMLKQKLVIYFVTPYLITFKVVELPFVPTE